MYGLYTGVFSRGIFTAPKRQLREKMLTSALRFSGADAFQTTSKALDSTVAPSADLTPPTQKKYEIVLPETTMDNILASTHTIPLVLPWPYEQLGDGDKRAIAHLVRVARIMEDVYLEQLHPENLSAKAFLEQEAKQDPKAAKALAIFNLQQGIEGTMRLEEKHTPMPLFKDLKMEPGKAFYPMNAPPEQLTEQIVDYLWRHPGDLKQFLREDVVIRREGKGFKAVPFNKAFPEKFADAAYHLRLAAASVTHKGLEEYLNLQADALVAKDGEEELQKAADKVWMEKMENSPIEFCIVRSYYQDRLTFQILEALSEKGKSDTDFKHALEAACPKDNFGVRAKAALGVRLGLRSKSHIRDIELHKKYLPGLNQEIYEKDWMSHEKALPYPETVIERLKGELKQSDLDGIDITCVDMIALSGSQLQMPSTPIGGWTTRAAHGERARIVCYYPTQLAFRSQEDRKSYHKALIDPSDRGFLNRDTAFARLTGHELGHLLGPRKSLEGIEREAALGKYGLVLEELKADMVYLMLTDYMFEHEKKVWPFLALSYRNDMKAGYLALVGEHLPSTQPSLDEPHKLKNVMILNYFLEKGLYLINEAGQISMNATFIGWPAIAKKLFKDIIRMQLDGDVVAAEKFVTDYGQLKRSKPVARRVLLRNAEALMRGYQEYEMRFGWGKAFFENYIKGDEAAVKAVIDAHFKGDAAEARAYLDGYAQFNGNVSAAKDALNGYGGYLSHLAENHRNLKGLKRYTAFDQTAANQLMVSID